MRDRPEIALPRPALIALQTLEDAGYEAWCVGGFVRDALRGESVHDLDIATSAPWRETCRLFRAQGFAAHETGTAFGTVTVVVEDSPIEVTTFRADGSYLDSRHPSSVRAVSSINEDLARRDYTMNALAYHPSRGFCDPFGGEDDLRRGIIRAVGDASTRFQEDALRIMRGLRFASQLGFSLEDDTALAMRQEAWRLRQVAVERVRIELERLLTGQGACEVLIGFWDVLAVVLPELEAMAGCPQNTPYHIYDVLGHSAHVIAASPATPLSRWAALFHDVGKPSSRTVDSRGRDHFKGHALVGSAIARKALRRLKAPAHLTDDVCLLVERHECYAGDTDASVLRALNALGGRTDLYRALLQLQMADNSAKAPGVTERAMMAHAAARRFERLMREGAPFTLAQLAVDGNDLIAAGWKPGPRLGAILDEMLQAVMDGALQNDREALLRYASMHSPL